MLFVLEWYQFQNFGKMCSYFGVTLIDTRVTTVFIIKYVTDCSTFRFAILRWICVDTNWTRLVFTSPLVFLFKGLKYVVQNVNQHTKKKIKMYDKIRQTLYIRYQIPWQKVEKKIVYIVVSHDVLLYSRKGLISEICDLDKYLNWYEHIIVLAQTHTSIMKHWETLYCLNTALKTNSVKM